MTRSQRRRTRVVAAKTKSMPFKSTIHVSACLERPEDESPGEFGYAMKKLFFEDGNLIGVCFCGDKLFVCRQDEIQVISEFLNKLISELNQRPNAG